MTADDLASRDASREPSRGLDPNTPVDVWINGERQEGWVCVTFVDPDRPEGEEFLGAVFAEEARWPMLGLFDLNPGGEMAVYSIPDEHLPTPELRNRLLTREEMESL